MRYEITKGHPERDARCSVVGIGEGGDCVWYFGYFNRRTGMWRLYPRGMDAYRKGVLTLPAREVHMRPVARATASSVPAAPKPVTEKAQPSAFGAGEQIKIG